MAGAASLSQPQGVVLAARPESLPLHDLARRDLRRSRELTADAQNVGMSSSHAECK